MYEVSQRGKMCQVQTAANLSFSVLPLLLPINTVDDTTFNNDPIRHQDFNLSLPSLSNLLETDDFNAMSEFFYFLAVNSITEFRQELQASEERGEVAVRICLSLDYVKLNLVSVYKIIPMIMVAENGVMN
jgi:hypothetical protein